MNSPVANSLALHSGDYVTRYNAKSLNRVAALARRMNVDDRDDLADFACGNGMLLQVIGDRTGSYDGVDFSSDFIDSANRIARQRGLSNYRYHCMDIVDFCKDHPEAFSVASTLDFCEHINDETFVRIYSAIQSSLRPGGRLYLHTPNLAFFLERLKDCGILRQFPEHIAVRDRSTLIDLLQEAGFEKVNMTVKEISHYNVLKVLHPISKVPFIGKTFAARLWIEVSVPE